MKIKIITSILILFITQLCFSQNKSSRFNSLNWKESFKTAKEIAKIEKKPILVFFTGSDWCGPCKRLVSDFFETEEFKEIADKALILYEADFPRNKKLVTKNQVKDNRRLSNKFNVSGYPTVLIIDDKERNYGLLKGYGMLRENSYHFDFLEQSLNRFHKKNR